jgi:hypothetical protein
MMQATKRTALREQQIISYNYCSFFLSRLGLEGTFLGFSWWIFVRRFSRVMLRFTLFNIQKNPLKIKCSHSQSDKIHLALDIICTQLNCTLFFRAKSTNFFVHDENE